MPPATQKANVTPPCLTYLLIYNSELLPNNSSEDPSDDDIEQAHIVFYSAKDRAVSRDLMLRQAGLAKALSSFSDMFATQGCEVVRSHKTLVVMLYPEKDFHIVAAVTAASFPHEEVSNKSKGAAQLKGHGKQNSRTDVKKSVDTDYLENAIPPQVVLSQLQRAYDEFKLLHGSFQYILSSASRTDLEKALEQFFTPWAWRWDIESLSTLDKVPSSGIHEEGLDFADYLGLPQHPSLAPELSSIEAHLALQDLSAVIPDDIPFTLICIKPPSLLHLPNRKRPAVPSVIQRHLITRLEQSPPVMEWGRRSSTTSGHHTMPAATEPATVSYMLSMPKISMSELGAVTAGVVNPRKWGWPGYLSLARSSASSRKASPVRSERPTSVQSENVKLSGGGTNGPEPIVVGSLPEPSALEIDLSSAVESSLKRSLSATRLQSPDALSSPLVEVLSPDESLRRTIPDPNPDVLGDQIFRHAENVEPSGEQNLPLSKPNANLDVVPVDADESLKTTGSIDILLDSEISDSGAQKGRVEYTVYGRLVFAALVGNVGAPSILRGDEVTKLMARLETALRESELRSTDQKATDMAPTGSHPTTESTSLKFVAFDGALESMATSPGYKPRSPNLFGFRQNFARYPTFTELFSRANNLTWYGAKRLQSRSTHNGEATNCEIFGELGKKDASLVDIASELDAILSQVQQSG